MIDLNRNIDYVILENLNMKEYIISDFLTLKLENGKTNIYIKGKKFLQCKRLMINILKQDVPIYDEIDSIDEAADTFKLSLWRNRIVEGPMAKLSHVQNETITPEQEFWGHCSNLKAWYENDYDTRLLHSNLAFPLLRALVEAGDESARKILKTEILERLESGHPNVFRSVLSAKLLKHFTEEERKQILQLNFSYLILYVEKLSESYPNMFPFFFKESLLDYLSPEAKAQLFSLNYPLLFSEIVLKMQFPPGISNFFKDVLLKYLSPQEIKQLIQENFPVILRDIEKIMKYDPNLFLYFFEERLIWLITIEERRNLIQAYYPIILSYIQDIENPEQLLYIFNNGILNYMNPEDKSQLIQQNYLIIIENLHHILRPEIADFPALLPHIIIDIFEERLFDYFNPKEKRQIIRKNFPILLICIKEITSRWSYKIFSITRKKWPREISDEGLIYLYLTVFNAIRGTELINDFLKVVVKETIRDYRTLEIMAKISGKEKESKQKYEDINESLSRSLFVVWKEIYIENRNRDKKKIIPVPAPTQNQDAYEKKCKYCLKVLTPKSLLILIRKSRVYCPHCGKINHQDPAFPVPGVQNKLKKNEL